jgi:1,4-dihydroxy-2-naphthoate octaprenyltransferase
VLVGSALAEADGAFRWDAAIAALIGALAIQVGVNYANDVSDAGRGADNPDRIGPTRAVATGLITARDMWIGVWTAFGIAALAGVYLIAIAGWVVAVIGVASIVAALGYTGGPLPYGYRALGEVFVFVFFGLVATVGSRYVHDRSAPLDAWLMAIPIGLLITAILVANNVRDIDTDRVVGKRTLAVVLGRGRTRTLFVATIVLAFVLTGLYPAFDLVPVGVLAALLALPLAPGPIRAVMTEESGPALIAGLKGTALLQLAYGVLAAAGIVLWH